MNNLYLIGMMGSGKSVTGKKLAEILGTLFIDLDERVQDRTRRKITDIFEKDGEAYFRQQETAALAEVCKEGPAVIATGGGTILSAENVERMKATGKVVFLETSLDI